MSKIWPRQGQIIEEVSITDTNKNPQTALDSLRAEIDEIDDELALLLARRFELTEEIGKTKAKLGRKLKDVSREEKVLERVSRSLSGRSSRDFIMRVFNSLIQESIKHQEMAIQADDSRNRSERLFPNVCIIGVGLIGGALARQIKKSFPNTNLFAIDLPDSFTTLNKSLLFEQVSSMLDRSSIERASLIVLACPPQTSMDVLKNLAPMLSPGQLVIDLCSVKTQICAEAERLDLNGAEFVGSHPFFGTEKSGFANSAEVQLSERTVCLVPTSRSSELSIARLKLWFSALGLKTFITDAKSHDATVAMTSHLIQLIASALGSVINEELIESGKADHLALSGGALAGLSRLMSSRPEMWSQISQQNRRQIERVLQKFQKELLMLTQSGNCEDHFSTIFTQASKVQAALLKK